MARSPAPSQPQRWLANLLGLALVLLVAMRLGTTLVHVSQRAVFPYDLMYWPDDYYLSCVLRLELGLSPYGNPSDANSWIYAPGAPGLGWLLLKPFGLARSFLAHKLLAQLWFWLAVASAAGLGRALERARSAGGGGQPLPLNSAQTLLLVAVLSLAAYMNPVADSLHPTNLELIVMSLGAWFAARFEALPARRRLLGCLLLPAAALCFKQTGAVAITASLVVCACITPAISKPERVRLAAASALSPLLVFGAMWLCWGSNFVAWVWEIPASAGFQTFKTKDLVSGSALWLYPVLTLWLFQLTRAFRSREEIASRSFLRASLPALIYTPLAMVALFKTLGGPNNLTLLLFLYTSLGAPALVNLTLRDSSVQRGYAPALASAILIGLTLASWSPRKRVPVQADYAYGAKLCEYVAQRQACGERVYLGRGMTCFLGAQQMPLDRVMSAEDVSQSTYPLGYGQRLRDAEYDVLIATQRDLFSPWLKQAQWPAILDQYSIFGRLDAGPHGDVWTEGFSDLMGPAGFYERKRERGKHSVNAPGRCDFVGAAPYQQGQPNP